jgi:hypothetical protein
MCTGGRNAGVRAAIAIGVMLLFGISATGCMKELENANILTDPAYRPATLSWTPPVTYEDGSPLDPASEIANYEIFVLRSPEPSPDDVPAAIVEGGEGRYFNLLLIMHGPEIGGSWVTMRAVSVEGKKSGFAPSIPWRW